MHAIGVRAHGAWGVVGSNRMAFIGKAGQGHERDTAAASSAHTGHLPFKHVAAVAGVAVAGV